CSWIAHVPDHIEVVIRKYLPDIVVDCQYLWRNRRRIIFRLRLKPSFDRFAAGLGSSHGLRILLVFGCSYSSNRHYRAEQKHTGKLNINHSHAPAVTRFPLTNSRSTCDTFKLLPIRVRPLARANGTTSTNSVSGG